MTEGQYDRVLDAIQSLDDKLSTFIESHHAALLDQERRNSQFASKQELAQLSRRMDDFSQGVGSREARIKSLEDRISTESSNSFWRSANLTGYLVSALISGFAVTGSLILAHVASHQLP